MAFYSIIFSTKKTFYPLSLYAQKLDTIFLKKTIFWLKHLHVCIHSYKLHIKPTAHHAAEFQHLKFLYCLFNFCSLCATHRKSFKIRLFWTRLFNTWRQYNHRFNFIGHKIIFATLRIIPSNPLLSPKLGWHIPFFTPLYKIVYLIYIKYSKTLSRPPYHK